MSEIQITARGPRWFQYRAAAPETTNPRLLQDLLTAGFSVVSLAEVPRNLEQVYLQAVNNTPDREERHVA
jgi:hypothetical protein